MVFVACGIHALLTWCAACIARLQAPESWPNAAGHACFSVSRILEKGAVSFKFHLKLCCVIRSKSLARRFRGQQGYLLHGISFYSKRISYMLVPSAACGTAESPAYRNTRFSIFGSTDGSEKAGVDADHSNGLHWEVTFLHVRVVIGFAFCFMLQQANFGLCCLVRRSPHVGRATVVWVILRRTRGTADFALS